MFSVVKSKTEQKQVSSGYFLFEITVADTEKEQKNLI